MNKVLIVGRPNVGKSSLFNRLAKKKSALVINQPGVTRDILKQKCSWWGGEFEVWDSGGLWSKESQWGPLINKQVRDVISQADLILFVMSALSGFQSEDKKIFKLIKKSGRPFLTLVNKVDDIKKAHLLLSDFFGLGETPLPCSFEQGTGVPEIVQWILDQTQSATAVSAKLKSLPAVSAKTKVTTGEASPPVTEDVEQRVCLLLAGKINVGKSTLSNVLLKQNRSLVSPCPGTTLDVVQDTFTYGSQVYSLYDTAGFMRAKKNKMESLAHLKTTQHFKSANLILLLLDGSAPPDRMSARILSLCGSAHKPVILVVNKWDKAYRWKKAEYRQNIQQKFAFYCDLPVVFVSALKGIGLGSLMKKVEEVYHKSCFRVSTSELNRFWKEVIRKAPSPVYGTKNVQFYYLTQTQQSPPVFIAFANHPEGVRDSYKRFIIKQIQKKWNLKGVPVRLSILPRREV